jgi:hypothetical protein
MLALLSCAVAEIAGGASATPETSAADAAKPPAEATAPAAGAQAAVRCLLLQSFH